jgi:hypothetical protein
MRSATACFFFVLLLAMAAGSAIERDSGVSGQVCRGQIRPCASDN